MGLVREVARRDCRPEVVETVVGGIEEAIAKAEEAFAALEPEEPAGEEIIRVMLIPRGDGSDGDEPFTIR